MKYLLCLALLFPLALIHAQNEKIDPRLWDKLQSGEQAECLIIMSTQADLRPAEFMTSKADKGTFVYETLVDVAESTQEPVREIIRATGAPIQTFWVINGMWTRLDAGLALELAAMPEVARIEDNPVWHLSRPPQDEIIAEDRVLTPISWGLTKIKADQVWTMGYKGAGVVVGGQDTGYEWAHPAIKQKYRGWNGSTADHNYNWHDAIHSIINGGTNSCGLNLNHPCDDNNHGTHTIGTMTGGPSNDSIIGVAPEAEWMGCRNMEEGDGTPSTYIECFQWFIAPTNLSNASPDPTKSPDVINNSWGCPTSEGCNSGNFATMETVVNNVRAAGILVVVSAGNDGPSCSTVNSPAAIFAGSFSVGATNSSDNIAGFSSRGPVTVYTNIMKPNVSAPGVNILSCIGHDNNLGYYSYASWQGTSMAGPHVAGLAALIMSARPDLKGQVNTLEDIIESTAVELFPSTLCGTDTPTSTPNNTFGHGRIDALAAVTAALALPVEFLSFSGVNEESRIHLNWRTASESGCARFEVQRSADGLQWETLGALLCAGNSSTLRVYDYWDENPLPGMNFFRLRQVDWNGAAQFSNTIAIRTGLGPASFRLTPQPGQNSILVEVAGIPQGRTTLSLFNAHGQLLRQYPVADRMVVDAPSMLAGVYLARFNNEQGQVIAAQKLVWW